MFQSSELSKGDVSRLLNTTSDGIFDASKSRAEALADRIKAALTDLSETLAEEESHVEKLISDRPITTHASAFALGSSSAYPADPLAKWANDIHRFQQTFATKYARSGRSLNRQLSQQTEFPS